MKGEKRKLDEKITQQFKSCKISTGLVLGLMESGDLLKFFSGTFLAYCIRSKKINAKKRKENNLYDAKRKNNTGTY